jgi:hypothetical protein
VPSSPSTLPTSSVHRYFQEMPIFNISVGIELNTEAGRPMPKGLVCVGGPLFPGPSSKGMAKKMGQADEPPLGAGQHKDPWATKRPSVARLCSLGGAARAQGEGWPRVLNGPIDKRPEPASHGRGRANRKAKSASFRCACVATPRRKI